MTSGRTRRVTERGLKREYVHAPLHSVWHGNASAGERDLPTNKQGEPVEVDGRNVGNRLRRLPLWRELEGKYAAQGKWLRPYSSRDSWSHEAGRYTA